MKKRVLCAALASMMALSMTACSSGSTATTAAETKAVSYTHLDVYKRQVLDEETFNERRQ